MNPFFGKKIGLVAVTEVDDTVAREIEKLGGQVYARSTGTDLDFVFYGKCGVLPRDLDIKCLPVSVAESWIENERVNPTPIGRDSLLNLLTRSETPDRSPEAIAYLIASLANALLVAQDVRESGLDSATTILKKAEEGLPIGLNKGSIVKDAQRWNGLLSSPAIRVLGTAGLNGGTTPYAHMGLELMLSAESVPPSLSKYPLIPRSMGYVLTSNIIFTLTRFTRRSSQPSSSKKAVG